MRVQNARGRRSYRHFGDDGTDLSSTSSSDLGSGWLTGQTDTSGSDTLGIGPLSSPEADVGSTPGSLTNTDQGSVLFDNSSGSTPTTDAGSALWGGQSTSGGSSSSGGNILSSIFGSSGSKPLSQSSPTVAQALPFLAGVPTNALLLCGLGLIAVILLVRK